uniref:KRAB-related domain-containing protein n=2 Tax=Microcebus murinus TaxID=30608 RepID=A0A8C5XWJ7_MICMU
MDRGRSFAKSSGGDAQISEKCKTFKDISKYFSKEEWSRLGYSQKTSYVYMKKNYDTMTRLGLKTNLPAFMSSKRRAIKSQAQGSAGQRQSRRNQ